MNLESKLSYKNFQDKTNTSNIKEKNENNLNQPLFLMLKIYRAKFINSYKHKTKLKLKIKIKETKLS